MRFNPKASENKLKDGFGSHLKVQESI